MTATFQRIVLASRPAAHVTPDNFRLETVPVPQPAEGEVLVRVHYLSLDPYMRGRMIESRSSYAVAQKLDETMIGGTVGVVEVSRNPKFAVGDTVLGTFGWQEYGISDGRGLMKVDTRAIPMSAYLGPVGMPGVTAWYGLNRICAPEGRRDRARVRRERRGGQRRRVSWRRRQAAARSASPAGRTSAATSPPNSDSMRASTTASTPTCSPWPGPSARRRRRAWTGCSRTSAESASTVPSPA